MDMLRKTLKDKQRIVVKIGSSSLQHKETGNIDYLKLEKLVRELCHIRNQGKDVVLVTSGAIAVGKQALQLSNENISELPNKMAIRQACAAIGQGRLMMIYQKIFAEYNQIAAQILMTKNTIVDDSNREHAHNTFSALLNMGVIPIVNENDTIASDEIRIGENETLIGDNDTLSAVVAALIKADLLILLSDIDGLYTDDPRKNKEAKFIPVVEKLTKEYINMGKASTGSGVGTGGMNTKMVAAKIATSTGADMVIANSIDVGVLHQLLAGENIGTLFLAKEDKQFELVQFVRQLHQ